LYLPLYPFEVERLVEVLEAAMQEIAEVQEHRRAQTPLAQALHDFEQVHLAARRARGTHEHVARLRDLEEALAPAAQVVEVSGVIDGPRIDSRPHAGETGCGRGRRGCRCGRRGDL
jgi:hypothetical protein